MKTDSHGNSLTRDARTGSAVYRLGTLMDGTASCEMEIMGLSIRAPRGEGEDFLLTIRALDSDGAPQVAFHAAATLEECLAGLFNRLSNRSLKWKPDAWGR